MKQKAFNIILKLNTRCTSLIQISFCIFRSGTHITMLSIWLIIDIFFEISDIFTNKHNSLTNLLSIKAVKKNNKGILKIFVIGEIHTNKKYSHTNNFGHIYNNNNNMLFRQQSIDSWWDGEYNIRNKYGKYKYGKYKKLLSNIVKYRVSI